MAAAIASASAATPAQVRTIAAMNTPASPHEKEASMHSAPRPSGTTYVRSTSYCRRAGSRGTWGAGAQIDRSFALQTLETFVGSRLWLAEQSERSFQW